MFSCVLFSVSIKFVALVDPSYMYCIRGMIRIKKRLLTQRERYTLQSTFLFMTVSHRHADQMIFLWDTGKQKLLKNLHERYDSVKNEYKKMLLRIFSDFVRFVERNFFSVFFLRLTFYFSISSKPFDRK